MPYVATIASVTITPPPYAAAIAMFCPWDKS